MATPLKRLEQLRQRRRLLLAVAGGALTACGGGNEGPDAAPASTRPDRHPLGIGAGGTGYDAVSLLSAAVDTVAPIGVAGVQLGAAGARLCDGDGHELREADIAVGMTARVHAGRILTVGGRRVAQARSVVVDTQVLGLAARVDDRTVVILGQRVDIGSAVQPGVNGIGAGGTGQRVRVWGQLDPTRGRIVASRVDQAPPSASPMLRGLLTAIDRPSGEVQVGLLRARAADPSVLPAGLAAGALVRLVLGSQVADGTWDLLALRDDALRPADGLNVQLEGRVTGFSSAQRFELDGVAVDASQAAFEGLANLAAGAEAQVSGTMRDGVLIARTVAAEAAEALEFEGRIDSLDTLNHRFTVGGQLLHWSLRTSFRSSAASDLRVGRKVAGLARWVPGQTELEVTRLTVEK